MIPSIDPGIGIKEDPPKPPVPRSGNSDFSRVLQRAKGTSGTEHSRKTESAKEPDDPRNRVRYGQTAGEPPAEEQERTTVEGESTLDQAAPAQQNPHLQPANDPQVSLNDEGESFDLARLALTDLQADEGSGTSEDVPPIDAQIGQAAWRLGPHGQAEEQFAEKAGLVFPGSSEAELITAGTKAGKQAVAFQEAGTLTGQAELSAAGQLADVVSLSEKAAGKQKTERIPLNDQVHLEAAQGRNELLGRLAALDPSEDGEGVKSTLQQNAFLRDQLQINGMLMKSARSATLDSVEGTAPLSLAQAAPPLGTVDLTQIFETPTDNSVQQRVVESVANRARWLITNQREEVSFRLHPEHLGSLQMKIVREDGVFRVDMTVDNLSAKQLLESNLNDLRNLLGSDHPDGEFLFNVDVRQGQDQSELMAKNAASQNSAMDGAESIEVETDPSLARRVLGHGGLSIYA